MPNDEPRTTLNRYTRIFKQVTPRAEKYKSSLFDYASFFVRQTVYGQIRTENERFLPVDRGVAFCGAISARKHGPQTWTANMPANVLHKSPMTAWLPNHQPHFFRNRNTTLLR